MAKHRPEPLFVRYLKTGDPEDLAQVFDMVAPEILRVATHLTRDVLEAEDAVQETFLTAIEKGNTFRRGARVVPWLLAILCNHIRQNKRNAKRDRRADAVEPSVDADPAEGATGRELHREVDTAITGIPEPYRQVLSLHLQKHVDTRRIAEALGRPLNTVRSQMRRGLDMLRQALPAGLATGAAVSVTTGRGLAAVKAEVLRRAEVTTVTSTAAVSMGRVLAILLVCATIVTGVVWSLPGDDAAATNLVSDANTSIPETAGTSSVAAKREQVAANDVEAEDTRGDGPVIRVVDDATGRPLPGLEVVVTDQRTRAASKLDLSDELTSAGPLQGRVAWDVQRQFFAEQFRISRQRYTTDTDGCVRIKEIDGATAVWCRANGQEAVLPLLPHGSPGHKYGAAIIESRNEPDERFDLRMVTPRKIVVDVFDAGGEPAAGVPVELTGEAGFSFFGAWLVATDGKGRATFPDVHYLDRIMGKRPVGEVALSCPLGTRVFAPVNLLAPPKESIRLSLPATCTLRVTVRDRHGEPEQGRSLVHVKTDSGGELAYVAWNGTVSVHNVDTRATVDIQARNEKRRSRETWRNDKPLPAGETVDVSLGPTAGARFLRLRPVDPKGTLVETERLEVEFSVIGRPSGVSTLGWTQIQTPAKDGTVELEIAEPGSCAHATRAKLFVYPKKGAREAFAATIELDPLRQTVTDNGDIRLNVLALLASGEIVDEDDHRVPGLVTLDDDTEEMEEEIEEIVEDREFEGEVRESGFDEEPKPQGQRPRVMSHGDGTFHVYGNEMPRGGCGLQAWARGYEVGFGRVLAGRHDLKVRVRKIIVNATGHSASNQLVPASQCAMEGSVAVADGQPEDQIRVRLFADDPDHPQHGECINRFRDRLDGGFFHISGLPEVKVRLELWLDSEPRPLKIIRDLRLERGRITRDARLDYIELPSTVRTRKITILDENGAPMRSMPEDATVFSTASQGTVDDLEASGQIIDSNTVRILASKPMDVDVEIPGYRVEKLRGVVADQVVQLRKGVPLTVRCPELPRKLQGSFFLQCKRRDLPEPPENSNAYRIEPRLDLTSGASSTVYLPAPGRYVLYVYVRSQSQWRLEIDVPESGSTRELVVEERPKRRSKLKFSLK